jgi:hypothetical protein
VFEARKLINYIPNRASFGKLGFNEIVGYQFRLRLDLFVLVIFKCTHEGFAVLLHFSSRKSGYENSLF